MGNSSQDQFEKMHKKMVMNSYYHSTPSSYYVFFDPDVAESITEETKIIQKNLSKSLQVPNIIVSLQSNNQKD